MGLALVASGVLVAQPVIADPVALQPGELVVNGDAEQPATVGWLGALSRATHGVGGYPAAVIVDNTGLTGETFAGGAGMFFGSGAVSTATQTIDLSASAAAIDNGEVDALLSAYIGGYSTQADNAQVSYAFRDAQSVTLSTVTFGPVLVGDRAGASGFVPFRTTERLAVGTREVVVSMRMVRSIAPANDGYVDNVSLVLDAPSPAATPDTAETKQHVAVTVGPSTNDTPGTGATIVAESVRFFEDDIATTALTTSEGAYEVDVATGAVTFEPAATFLGTTTPVKYRVSDSSGQRAVSTITIEVTADPPIAVDDARLHQVMGTSVDIDVLTNDKGSIVTNSVVLYDSSSGTPRPSPYIVADQGRWSVQSGGDVRFTPEPDFLVDPTPVEYRVTDANGLSDFATIVVTYLPEARDDLSSGHSPGAKVVVDVLANDLGDFDADSVRILSPVSGSPVDGPVDIAGEGAWTVEVATGTVTFTPVTGYFANPTPINYQVTDVTGDTVSAKISVTFVPEAADDLSSANIPGTRVTVDVVGNDRGDLRAETVVIIDPVSGDRTTQLVVANEGTWTVDSTTGAITFAPQAGFTSNPTPVRYEVEDSVGTITSAVVTILYLTATVGAGGDALATTGVDVKPMLLIAALLAAAGVLLMSSSRRRRVAMSLAATFRTKASPPARPAP